jgi:hypothetical protein
MIAEIRKHIKESINRCSSKYLEIKNPFPKPEDIIQTKLDRQYAVIFNPATLILDDTEDTMSLVSVTVRTYAQADKDKLKTFDEAYSQALLIKSLILDISSLNSKEYIKGIVSSDVVPAEVPDSQDVYTYETNFNFTISYGIGD